MSLGLLNALTFVFMTSTKPADNGLLYKGLLLKNCINRIFSETNLILLQKYRFSAG
jgi:hypothetical protein